MNDHSTLILWTITSQDHNPSLSVKQNNFRLLSRVGNSQLAPLQIDMSEDVQIIKDKNNVCTVAEYMLVRDTATALKC